MFVGYQQPPSEWMSFLHLNDCELPCWIGITPGKTTLAEAQQQLTNVYGDTSLYQLTGSDGHNYKLISTVQRLELVVGIQSGIESQPIIQYITLDPQKNSTDGQPTLADLYNFWGTPDSIPLSAGKPTPNLYFKHQSIMVVTERLTCDKFIPTQPIQEIVLIFPYRELASEAWHGFQRCYN